MAGQHVTGNYNSGIGVSAGQYVSGDYNSGIGAGAGVYVTGTANLAEGYVSGQHVDGDANLASGAGAGNYVTGNGNIALGLRAGSGSATTPLAAGSTVAIGSDTQASANYGVAIGYLATTSSVGAVALGHGASAGYGGAVALGENSAASAAPVGSGYLTGSAAPLSEVSVGNAAGGLTRRLTNVADGSAASDAVTVAQLTVVDGRTTTLGNALASIIGGGTVYDPATGALGGGSFQAGSGGGSYASVAQALAAIATGSAPGTQGVQYDDASHASVTLNPGGTAAALHNVAAGTLSATSGDAVNGSQLYATNVQVAVNSALIGALDDGTAGPFRADNRGGSAAPAASGANAVAGGFGAAASGASALALGSGARASGSNSVALGAGSSDGGVSNVVSVGAPGAERQITNVAAGTRATDAINLGQLQTGLSSTLGAANAYTDARIATLTYDLGKVRRDASAGTAAALAFAALPQAMGPGRGMIAGGFGVYRNQTAFAVSASRAFDDHAVVKAGGTIDTHGTTGAAVGVGYQF